MPLFETLDWLEQRLGASGFLLGPALTEADIRLFTTPDPVRLPCITATSSATSAAFADYPKAEPVRAGYVPLARHRRARSIWATSSGIITRATAPSTQPASSRVGPMLDL